MQSEKLDIEEISKNFDDFKELTDSRGNVYLDFKKLAIDKINVRKNFEGKLIKLTLPKDKEECNQKLDEIGYILLSSLREKFTNDQLMLLNDTTKINNPAIYKELLLMTLRIISHTSNAYKQKLLEDGFNEWRFSDREINTVTFLMQMLTTLLNLSNSNREVLPETKTNQAINDELKVIKVLECFNDLENRIVTNETEIKSLCKELENAKHDLEFVILCQERGSARPGDDKVFTENIEVTLYTKELETLRKSFVEMECINTSLEQKIVHLLNDKNILMSKNVLLEDHIFSKKKIMQKKNNFQERINIPKQMSGDLVTSKLAKNDMMSKIKEQADIINNMSLHNTQLNAFIEKLKKDNKICTQTHVLFRRVITEKEIQYLKLDHSLKNLKILNTQLQSDLNSKDKVIEKLEIQLKLSLRKIDDICKQLTTSEEIRIGQQRKLRKIAQIIANYRSTVVGVPANDLADIECRKKYSLPNIETRNDENSKTINGDAKFNDTSVVDKLQRKNLLNLNPIKCEIEGSTSTISSAIENAIISKICDIQNES